MTREMLLEPRRDDLVVVAREIAEESYPVEDNFFDMWQEGQITNPYQSVTLETGGEDEDNF